MPNQQHGLFSAGSVQSRDKVFLAIIRANHLDIRCWKASRAQMLRHGLRRGGYISNRVCRIDLNELLEDIVRELSRSIVDLGRT